MKVVAAIETIVNAGSLKARRWAAPRSGIPRTKPGSARMNPTVASGVCTMIVQALEQTPHHHRQQNGIPDNIYDVDTGFADSGRGRRISSIKNKSVSKARRWIEALRLSINCEPMEGCARTNSKAIRESLASRSSTVRNAS